MSTESPDELSSREKEILELVATGATNRQIAAKLTISINTVKTHLRNIFTKLCVESRTEAALWAVKYGVIEMELEGVASVDEDNTSQKVDWGPEPPSALGVGQYLALGVSLLFILLVTFWPKSVQGTRGSVLEDSAQSTEQTEPVRYLARWRTKAPLPTPRSRFAQAQIGSKVFVIGGSSANERRSASVEVYDVAQDSWGRGRDKPSPVANVGAAVVEGLIYVPGGLDASNRVRDILEVYNPQTDTWDTATPLPIPLCAYAIAPFKEGFYVFGGWDGETYRSSVYYYEVSSGAWEEAVPMKTAKGFSAAALVGDRIYLVGGYDGSREVSSCSSYDPVLAAQGEDPWEEHAPMSVRRAGHAVTVFQGNLYVVGGGLVSSFAYNERYDVENNVWSNFESPVLGRWRTLGLSTANTKDGTYLYAVGGWNGNYLGIVEAYQASFRVYLP
ncbi:MAG: LuxR C-terminal-related transcriptional regulator [Chloroflexota bacterium]|nr:LuxR C-terminal-related transcriptional regulator [Chloroflexota bacterium]